jgi:hypothetical protein
MYIIPVAQQLRKITAQCYAPPLEHPLRWSVHFIGRFNRTATLSLHLTQILNSERPRPALTSACAQLRVRVHTCKEVHVLVCQEVAGEAR